MKSVSKAGGFLSAESYSTILIVLMVLPSFVLSQRLLIPNQLRLLVTDSNTDYFTNKPPKFYDQEVAIPLNYMLAAKHVNERRSDILPVLSLPNCSINVSILAYVDDGWFASKSMFAIQQYESDADVVVGLGTSSVTQHVAYQTAAYGLPAISHWASSPRFSNKQQYPWFARTIADDGDTAKKVVRLLHQWGYKQFGLLYEEAQSSIRAFYDSEREELGMTMTAFTVKRDNPDASEDSVKAIDSRSLNVLVIHGTLNLLRDTLAQLLLDHGFLNKDKVLIFSDFDRVPSELDYERNPLLRKVVEGSFRVELANEHPVYFTKYLDKWITEFTSKETIDYLNAYLPPNGYANNSDIAALDISNWAISMNVSGPEFFAKTRSTASIVWGTAYDVVVALTLAKCELESSSGGSTHSRQELFNQLLKTEFEGMSGYVQFTPQGNRNPKSLVYQLKNWDMAAQLNTIAQFNEFSQRFEFTAKPVFRLGEQPPEITPPEHIRQQLPRELQVFGYVEVAVLNLFCAVCFIWVYINRNHKAVFAAQRTFLNLIILGCLIGSYSILGFAADDSGYGISGSQDTCMLGPWAFSIGVVLALAALLGKKIRVLYVFRAPMGSTARALVRRPVVIGVIFLILAIEAALLTAWTVVNPLVWKRKVVVVDKNGFALVSYGMCAPKVESSHGSEIGFLLAVLAVQGIMLISVGVLNAKVKHFPEEFQEHKYVSLMIVALVQLYLLVIPVFIAIISNPIGRFLVLSSFTFCTCFFFLFFMFVPKMEQVRNNLLLRNWQHMNLKQQQQLLDSGSSPDSSSGCGGFEAPEVGFEEGIRNMYVRDKFHQFAEKNFVVESLYFYLDVDAFRSCPTTASGALDKDRAKDIYDIYIREGGLLQINISAATREDITRRYQSFVSPKRGTGGTDIENQQQQLRMSGDSDEKANTLRAEFASMFSPAQEEIVNLLNHGAWRGFVNEGGIYQPTFGRFRGTQESISSLPSARNSKQPLMEEEDEYGGRHKATGGSHDFFLTRGYSFFARSLPSLFRSSAMTSGQSNLSSSPTTMSRTAPHASSSPSTNAFSENLQKEDEDPSINAPALI